MLNKLPPPMPTPLHLMHSQQELVNPSIDRYLELSTDRKQPFLYIFFYFGIFTLRVDYGMRKIAFLYICFSLIPSKPISFVLLLYLSTMPFKTIITKNLCCLHIQLSSVYLQYVGADSRYCSRALAEGKNVSSVYLTAYVFSFTR